jgi:glutathione-specific gamma-glutamylcyclotransferase
MSQYQTRDPDGSTTVSSASCESSSALAPEQPAAKERDGDLWVFGYGSLMWNPGFEYLERASALLIGLHRSLCLYSSDHRGTPERPGLVLGLDHGGGCRGIAYRVSAALRQHTLAYLRQRELVNRTYHETMRRIRIRRESASPQSVMALVFVADRRHPQYAGRLDVESQFDIVRQSHGRSGPNRDYVLHTMAEIEAQGCRDPGLHVLARRLIGGNPG